MTKRQFRIILVVGLISAIIVFLGLTRHSTKYSYGSCMNNPKGQTIGEYLAERGLSSRIPIAPDEKNQVRKFIIESDSEPAAGSVGPGDILKIYGTRPDNQLFILFTDGHGHQ